MVIVEVMIMIITRIMIVMIMIVMIMMIMMIMSARGRLELVPCFAGVSVESRLPKGNS